MAARVLVVMLQLDAIAQHLLHGLLILVPEAARLRLALETRDLRIFSAILIDSRSFGLFC